MYTTNVRQLFVRTDKKFIPSLPRYAFDGKIHVVQSESEAERAVEVLKKSPRHALPFAREKVIR